MGERRQRRSAFEGRIPESPRLVIRLRERVRQSTDSSASSLTSSSADTSSNEGSPGPESSPGTPLSPCPPQRPLDSPREGSLFRRDSRFQIAKDTDLESVAVTIPQSDPHQLSCDGRYDNDSVVSWQLRRASSTFSRREIRTEEGRRLSRHTIRRGPILLAAEAQMPPIPVQPSPPRVASGVKLRVHLRPTHV